MTTKKKIEAAKRVLGSVGRRAPAIADDDWLSTGSTLLNLACSGRIDGGFAKGRYHFVVGDSVSGKTFLSMTCLAEASVNPAFDDYRFVYDNVEDGMLMDVRRFFGEKVAERLEPPEVGDDGVPLFSRHAEEFYFRVDDAVKCGRPFIWILDSMDALDSEPARELFDKQKEAYGKGKDLPASYGDSKAKINSQLLRTVLGGLRDTKSILIVISQTRDSFDPFVRKTRGGGHALRFYATIELWSSVKGRPKRTVRGKERQIGVECKIVVKKNRITGRERSVVVPIYHSYGIDDLGSCIQYLVDEGRWKRSGQKVTTSGWGPRKSVTMSIQKLAALIEEKGWVEDLRELVGEVWGEIEKASELKRKRRYE